MKYNIVIEIVEVHMGKRIDDTDIVCQKKTVEKATSEGHKDNIMMVRDFLDFPASQKPKTPSRLLYKNSPTANSFQAVMKPPLITMQIFGYLPVQGVTGTNYRSLKFSWKSWRVLLNLIFLTGHIIHLVCFCVNTKIDRMLVVNAICFHLEGVLLSMLFLHLAKQWPQFVKEWHLVEVAMKRYELSLNLKRKLIVIMASMMGFALLEHVMSSTRPIYYSIKERQNDLYEAIYDYFTRREFAQVFRLIPFNIWLGLFFKILIVQKTFMWTFLDVFIILVSICFNSRLKQISKKLRYMVKIEVPDENLWRTVREDYVKLSRLCDIINKHLSWFIIVSYSTNMYHILSQLFSSLRPTEDTFQKFYFYASFLLLILRVSTVCIFGGAIFDEHEHITRLLTAVPSVAYNVEVERFIIHVATCETALSGKNFFRITRNLILKVTSAIVTYELVLIQFNQQEFKTKEL